MKNKKLYFVLLSSLIIMSSCGNNVVNSNESHSNESENNNSSTSLDIDNSLVFANKFIGDYNRPGLYEKNGVEHVMPEIQKETGMEINVEDYGAKKDDPNFDNYSSFRLAIENAVEGDTIYIPNGKYYFKNYGRASSEYYAHIVLKSGITLKGESKENTILVSNFLETMNRDESTTVIASVNVKSVVIKNLTVTSNTSDDVLPDPDNSNLQTTTYTAPKYGITAASGGDISSSEKQAKNILIENCFVEKFQRMGVRIAKAQEVVVRSCSFQKATCLGGGGMGYGVNIQGYGNDFNVTDTFIDTKYNVVENCSFVGPYLRHGTLIQYYAHNNLIQNNTYENLLLDSIDMHGEDEYSNEICNNQIINTRKGAGIGLGNSGATHDASGRNNYIHDNVIKNGLRGIDVILGTPDTIIYNNKIEDVSSTGIKCSNANGTFIVKNEFKNVGNNSIDISYSYISDDPSLGIPNDYVIQDNKFTSCDKGIYLDSKGENFVIKDNEFNDMDEEDRIIDESSSFVLPEKSNLTDPVEGDYVLPTENFFITMESQDKPAIYQKNLKLKTSNLEPFYNRIIYALFDKTSMPSSYNKVYLSITAKAQVGTPTINIFTNTTYVDWTTDTICWNNSKLHHDSLALIKSTDEDPVNEFVNFTFPFAGYEFHTYYIDVTEAYNLLPSSLFTMVFTNENIDESYMEIYSNKQDAKEYSQALRLIFTN